MTKINPPPDIKEAKDFANIINQEVLDTPIENKEKVWLYRVRMSILGTTAVFTVVIVLVFLWNLIAPTSLRWLSIDDWERIKELSIAIIVGLLMSISTTYFFKK
jgi:hypothetical protein